MSDKNLDAFIQLVLNDETLEAELRDITDPPEFIARVMELGVQSGCNFFHRRYRSSNAIKSTDVAKDIRRDQHLCKFSGLGSSSVYETDSEALVDGATPDRRVLRNLFLATHSGKFCDDLQLIIARTTPLEVLGEVTNDIPGIPPTGLFFTCLAAVRRWSHKCLRQSKAIS